MYIRYLVTMRNSKTLHIHQSVRPKSYRDSSITGELAIVHEADENEICFGLSHAHSGNGVFRFKTSTCPSSRLELEVVDGYLARCRRLSALALACVHDRVHHAPILNESQLSGMMMNAS